ncbi:hypothetical protein RPMA_02300 [Tardiphaga alba]|uniref:Uncharacterized protein n=1 Tax=Tardiphaga alba TaxID=340268 RepID=A0ABX8A2Q5_9BRAD|nr:hypothetical protein [Tardiphaga alba]QUS37824.1 hypothetical protein RPMA_02300 [Tardiphaga alba]
MQTVSLEISRHAPIILFGRDERGRPHGSIFDGLPAADVERAAGLMGMRTVAAESAALLDLSADLPKGRPFKSGSGFAPWVPISLYHKLLATAGLSDDPPPLKASAKPAEGGAGDGAGKGSPPGGSGADEPPAPKGGAKQPANFADIQIGSVVLAKGDDGDDAYYAAKVVSVDTNDRLGLNWTGYPDLPRFSRPRKSVALLHPEAATEAT